MMPNQPHVSIAPKIEASTSDEIDSLQASCREIAARGGETGEIANRILRASQELEALNAKTDAFLARYR